MHLKESMGLRRWNKLWIMKEMKMIRSISQDKIKKKKNAKMKKCESIMGMLRMMTNGDFKMNSRLHNNAIQSLKMEVTAINNT